MRKNKRGRGTPGFRITRLPYKVRVYLNNQVLIPASLIKILGISNIKYANVTFIFNGMRIIIVGVKLLRTKHTNSRQFTIPKEIREKYGIKPGNEIEIVEITPYKLVLT